MSKLKLASVFDHLLLSSFVQIAFDVMWAMGVEFCYPAELKYLEQ